MEYSENLKKKQGESLKNNFFKLLNTNLYIASMAAKSVSWCGIYPHRDRSRKVLTYYMA